MQMSRIIRPRETWRGISTDLVRSVDQTDLEWSEVGVDRENVNELERGEDVGCGKQTLARIQ